MATWTVIGIGMLDIHFPVPGLTYTASWLTHRPQPLFSVLLLHHLVGYFIIPSLCLSRVVAC